MAERYRVGRTLGGGAFAVVKECVERSTGREFALKVVNKDKCIGKVRCNCLFVSMSISLSLSIPL